MIWGAVRMVWGQYLLSGCALKSILLYWLLLCNPFICFPTLLTLFKMASTYSATLMKDSTNNLEENEALF